MANAGFVGPRVRRASERISLGNPDLITRETGGMTPLPQAPQLDPPKLAEPIPGSIPVTTREVVGKAIDEATDHVIQDLRRLKDEIERLIQGLEATRGKLQDHMDTHFQLGAECGAWADQLRDRMRAITEGEASPPKPSTGNGMEG